MTSVRTFTSRFQSRRRSSMLRRVVVLGGVGLAVFAVLFASSPTAKGYTITATTTDYVTTTGGGGYIGPASCPSGSVIYQIGASGASSYPALTRPIADCTNLNGAASAHSAYTGSLGTTSWGGAGDTTLTAPRCNNNEALVGMVVHKNQDGWAAGWQLICGTLPTGGSRRTSSTVFGWNYSTRAAPNQPETIQCPTGMVAVGIVAYVGGIMDRIGFRCGTISAADQATVTVTSSSSITYGSTLALTATGGTGSGAITFATTGSCTVSGSTLTATGNAGATCSVTATRAADTNYAAEPSATQTVTIQRAANTISFTNPGARSWSATPFNVTVSATSGITPSVSSTTPSVCSVSGIAVTMLSSGTCSLTASQGETTNHVAAVAVSHNFTINPTGRSAFTGNSATISGTTTGSKYVVERFTTTGVSTWSVPQGVTSIDYLVVGGGGGGGGHVGGGGGAGGVRTGSLAVTPGSSVSLTIGAGGAGSIGGTFGDCSATNRSKSGSNSILSTITAAGGGGGGNWDYCAALNGGSGGGGGTTNNAGAGNTPLTSPSQGNNGGGGSGLTGGNYTGGGGGGAGSVGTAGQANVGGNGGTGVQSGITGVMSYYGGGGGGGVHSSTGNGGVTGVAGTGGLGGGGNGNVAVLNGTAGAGQANTGGGGGGAGYQSGTLGSSNGGAGGSGIVVVRYELPTVTTPNLLGADDTGITTDDITSTRTLRFWGNAPLTSSIQLSVAPATSVTDTDSSTGTWTTTGSGCTANSTGGEWECTTAQLAPGLYKVRSIATTNMDGLTDTQTSSTALVVNIDTTSPTIAVTRSGTGTLTAGQTETITFTLSEASSTFAADDITFSGGTISALTTTSSTVYSVVFMPTANTQSGTGSISVALSRFTDTAGNNNTASNALSITYDTSRPSVTVSASPASVSSGSTSTVTFTVSESVTTFTSTDVSATLGTLTNFSGSGTSYSATFTASTTSGGTAIITVASGSISDANANTNATASTFEVTVTNTATSSGGRTSYVGNGSNGTNGVRYIVERFITAGTTAWTVPRGISSIDYLVVGGGAGGGSRHAGGGGAGGLRSSVTSTGGGASPESAMTVTPGGSLTVTVGAGGASWTNGSDSVLGNVTSIGGGTQSTAGGSGGGTNCCDAAGGSGTANQGFNGGRGTGSGTVSNWLWAGGGGGGAGAAGSNAGSSGGNAFGGAGGAGVTNSITGAAVCYAGGGGGGYSNQATNAGTIEGGKCGSTMVGGTSPRGANATAGATNTGSGGGGGGFDGGSGNYAGGAGGSGIVVVRYAVPDVSTPDLDAADDIGTNTDNITSATTLTFTGSAPVGSTVQLLVDGVASGNTCPTNSTTGAWSCDTGVLSAGDKVITAQSTTLLPDSTVTSTSSGLTVTIDTSAPTIALTRSGTGLLIAGQTETITFTLSEASSTFAADDITVSGGTIGSLTTTSSTVYSVVFTPTNNTNSGSGSISVALSRFTDTAGNNNTASNALSITYDTSRPSVTISASPASVTSGSATTVTFTVSESVTTFTSSDVSARLGTLTNFSGSGTTYTATFTSSPSSGGTAVITVASGSITDANTNANTSAFTNNITVTNTASSSGGRTSYLADGTNGTSGVRYFVERFTTTGSSTWTVPQGVTSVDVLAIGGGGGAGDNSGGGGSGGGVAFQSGVAVSGTVNLSVGAGGAAGTSNTDHGKNGSATTFGAISSNGGNGGRSSSGTGGASVSGSGAGGNGSTSISVAGLPGGNGPAYSITGTPVNYAGGGGGGGWISNTAGGAGGTGGGGAGGGLNGPSGVDGVAGTNSLGGGGGSGSTSASVAGAGGSGIVVVRYAVPTTSTPDLDAADDTGTTTDNITSATTLTFTGSAPVGSTVQLFVDGVSSGNTCTTSSTTGAWSCDTAVLTAGDKVITAESTTILSDSTVTSTSSSLTVTIDTTAPTVFSVSFTSSSGSDDIYKTGDVISVTVVFSESVIVSGSPRIALAGLTSKFATYASGSGTSSLVFTYTVASGDNDADGLSIAADTLSLNSGTIRDTSATNATLTHSAVATQSAHKVEAVAPTVTITRAGTGSLRSSQTDTITFTLSEASSDFAAADITVAGGSIGTLTTTSSTVYSVVFTPTSNTQSGTGSISVAGAQFTDAPGNDNTASTALSIPYDTAAPTVSLARSGSGSLRSGQTSTITFTLSEASSTFAVGDITVSGGSIGTLTTTSSTVYSVVFTPTSNTDSGMGSISVDGATFTDTVGNDNTASTALTISYDTSLPIVTITRAGSTALRSSQTDAITFTLSEASSTFAADDITVSGGSIGTLTTTSSTLYSAVFTPTANTQSGTGSISVAGARFTDTIGNNNTASSTLSISYDTAAPTVSMSASPASLTSGSATTVTFNVSEATTTFTDADVSARLGTLTNFSGSGATYTATFTASQSSGGTAVITVTSGSFTDVNSNANTSAFTLNVNVTNTTSSPGGRTSYIGNGTNGTNGVRYFVEQFTTVGTSTWTAPLGVTNVDYLVVAGGAAGGTAFNDASAGGGGGGQVLSGTLSGGIASSYTITVGGGGTAPTSTSGFPPGGNGGTSTLAVTSGATVATSTGGGGGSSFSTSGGFLPSSSGWTGGGGGSWASSISNGSTGTGGTSRKGGDARGDGTFADAQTGGGGGGAGGVGTNGTSTTAGSGGNGVASSITGTTVTYGGGGGGGKRTSSGSAGTGTDGGGNGGKSVAGSSGAANRGGGGGGGGGTGTMVGGAGGSGIVVVRYAVPDISTPDLDAADDTGVNTDNITSATTLTFTGAAPVGSTVQLFVDGVSSGSSCTASATTGAWSCDTGVLTAGDKVVTAESTTFLSDSTVTSTSSSLTVTIDTTAPTVSSVSITSSSGSDDTYKTGDVLSVAVAFSENVTVTGFPRIALAGLTSKFATYSSGSGTSSLVFTYTFASGDNDVDGLAIAADSLGLNSGTIRDAVSNDATLTHSAVNTDSTQKVDTAAPTVTITRAGSGSLKSGQTDTITFTLSEASSTFAVGDITVSGGSIGTLTTTSSTVYSVVFTPTTNTQSGTGSISVAGTTFTDIVGNDNTASSKLNITYDTAAPTVTIARAGSGSLKSGQTDTITFTLSEASSTFADGDITVSGGSIGTLTTTSSTVYSVVFTPTTNTQSGTGSISVAGTTFTDIVGNDNTASSALSISYDTLVPTVTVSRSYSGSIGVRANQTITFTLSEASSTFAAADITVTGGSIGSLTTVSSTVYRVLFTPTADTESGTATLSVSAAKFTDSAGNDNTESNTLSIPFDTREPTVTITRAGSGSLKSGQTDTITFTLSEASSTFTSADITVSGGSIGALTTTSSTVYSVVFTPTTNTQSGTGSISVAAARFTDATGNGNIASSTRSIPYDTLTATVSNVTSSTANGTIGISSTVSIQIVFSEAVTVTGTPQLTLETGATDRVASYASGSGTDTLTFTYTVQSGDTSSDLDYTSTNALSLNGGTIVDSVGNSATLTLPAPGGIGSLATNKAIVVASAPTQVVSVRTPLGPASGAAFSQQPRVSLQDTGGSVVTSDSSTVVTATVSSGASLVGTVTATAVNGVVTFTDLGISGTAGTAYTITYSATISGNALTAATQSVTPTVGAATQISVSTQPVGDTAGALLATAPVVSVLDSGNNVVTSASTSIIVSSSGGTLDGTKAVSVTNGLATFGDLTFAGTAGTNYTLTFTTSSLGSATSNNFSVGVGAAIKLAITTQASGAAYNEAFTTQPVIEIRDAGNNKVTSAANTVTATLSSGTVLGSNTSTLTATASSGVATFSGLGITGLPGSYSITYSSGSLANASHSLSLVKANQTITFADPTNRAWSATSFAVTPTASSGLNVSLASTTTSICSVSSFDITMATVGTCSLTATQSGNDYFNAAIAVSQSFDIAQASQTISFSDPADRPWSATTFVVVPSATSGLSVTVASTTSTVCSVSGATITMVKAGTCTLAASQSGDTNYEAASTVIQSFVIELATQPAFSLSSTTATFGSNLTLTTSGGSGSGSVTFTKVSGDCSVSNTTLTPTSASSCIVTATKAADAQYDSTFDTQTITINRAAQSTPLTLATTTVVYGQTLTVSGSGGEGSGAISYAVSSGTCTLNGAVLTPGNAGSLCEVEVTRALSTNYNSFTSAPISITIQQATPTLGTLVLATKTYGDAPFAFSAPSATYNSASVAGSWSYASAQTSVATINGDTATVTGGGTSSVTATFSPTDSTNYTTATTASTLTVNKATPTFSWSNVDATYNDADITIVSPAVATTAATGTWTYSSTDTSVVAISGTKFDVGNAGSAVITATFTPSNTTNYVSGETTTMTFTVGRANQASLGISSVTGTYGTALTLATSGGTTNGSITWGVSNGSANDCNVTNGRLTTTSIGTCTVTAVMAGSSNYFSVSNVGTTVTINAKPITVTATAKLKTYGDNDPALTFTTVAGALVGNDTLIGALARNVGEDVGEYTITRGSVANSNYDITYTTAKLTINAKPITVTATAKLKTYGDNDPALTYTTTVGALVGNDTLTGTLTRVAGDTVGEYTINQGTVTNTNNTNYDLTYVTAKLTINAKPITVTATAKLKTYGDNDPALTFTTVAGALVGNDTLTGALARNAGEDVGEYTITRGSVANSNYDITYTTAKLTINAKPITVTATAKFKTYGDSDPALTFTTAAGALVGNDTLTGSLTRDAGNTVGEYTINQGTVTNTNNTNYDISYTTAKLTINAKPITVTATAKLKTYGDNDPALTYTTPVGALVGNDTLTGSLTRVAGENVGEYTINQGTVTNTNNTNYDISYTTAKLTINAKPITVTATAKLKTYGDNDPALTYTTPVGALVGNDTLTGSLTRVAGENVGEYTINQGTVTNTNNTNYDISYTTAKLTINAKPITVTAELKTKIYNTNDPALTYTTPVGALVGNDTFSGALARVAGEQVASYPIRIGTLNNPNYLITFVDSALSITPAQQSQLTVSTTTITYQTPVALQATGGTEGDLSFSVVSSGSAGCSILNGTLNASGNAGSTCTVKATRAATTNFSQIDSSTATITVTRRAITVTGTAEEKTYGDADPGFRFSVTAGSLHGSDSLAGTLTRAAGENVGTYTINQGTLDNSNYTITYVSSQLTVIPRPITITATNKTKIFGQPDPALTYTVTTGNIVNSDVISGEITRAVGETLGNYNITRGTLVNNNYNITFVAGIFQITGAPQAGFTLTASSYSVVYQQTISVQTSGGNGQGTVSYSAQNGTGSCSVAGGTVTGTTAGTCIVTATKAAEGGYLEAISNPITVTVEKADQTITFAQIIDHNYSPTPMAITPTASSGAAVSIGTRTPNVCSTDDLEVQMLDSGMCTIAAEVASSRNYNAAPTVTRSFEIRAVVPFAPTITAVEPGDTTVSVVFTPGLSGGAAITTYRYSVDDGNRWTDLPSGTTSSPIILGNLPNTVEAKVRIMAVNRVGNGARSNMRAATPVAKRSLEWEVQRNTVPGTQSPNSATTVQQASQLPPAPARVTVQSVSGGRRTQVTAVRAAKDANIPVTYALISVRTRTNKLLARIKVLVDPTNPTTSVSVPYASSRVRVSVQFANDMGISSGGPAGINIAEGNTLEWTTVSNEARIKGTEVKGDLVFERGKSTLTYAMQQNLKKMAATVNARGGLIYVSGFAQKGEIKSAWMLEPLARARAEAVAKYLAKIGVRQWITFHGSTSAAMKGWQPVTGRQVVITTVMPNEI